MARGATPTLRSLRVFAFDPGLGRRLDTLGDAELTLTLPAERILCGDFAGPTGEYVEVIDIDPASGLFYPPVDLNDPALLARDGCDPDEADPHFHQQMVYAVAMATIGHFETALGRPALWAPRVKKGRKGQITDEFVRRLRIHPHALREANAYYSPEKKALLFGYFPAGAAHPYMVPGAIVFTCLSHDVIAHETTHALLDGLHPHWREASNPDILALHEAFADIVALFQHFTHASILRGQIARTRGDLEAENLLGQLAQEFGRAMGRGGALRDALGGPDAAGVWRRRRQDRGAIDAATGPHERGAILVAAVFDAFIAIYRSRTADLFRIATGGSGVLPPGALHPDLVARLAEAAAKAAGHVLEICIRALDYCPPVDVTFGDYLRAIITADRDLHPADERGYRVAVLEAFTAWGLVPPGLPVYSPRTLLWPTLEEIGSDRRAEAMRTAFEAELRRLILDVGSLVEASMARTDLPDFFKAWIVEEFGHVSFLLEREQIDPALRDDASDRKAWEAFRRRMRAKDKAGGIPAEHLARVTSRNLLDGGLHADREGLWRAGQLYGMLFWSLLTDKALAPHLDLIGIRCEPDAPPTVRRSRITGLPSIEVHSVRMARRLGERDQVEKEYVVELLQARRGWLDPAKQREMDAAAEPLPPDTEADFVFRAGCTLLVDARTFRIRRVIRTAGDIRDAAALERVRRHIRARGASAMDAFRTEDGLHAMRGASFAHLHRHPGEG